MTVIALSLPKLTPPQFATVMTASREHQLGEHRKCFLNAVALHLTQRPQPVTDGDVADAIHLAHMDVGVCL